MIDLDLVAKYRSRFARILRKSGGGDYEVGYGKPPVASRWKKNQSGNPSGRRKVVVDGWDAFRAGLQQRIRVLQGEQGTTLTSICITVRRVFELAIQGRKNARTAS